MKKTRRILSIILSLVMMLMATGNVYATTNEQLLPSDHDHHNVGVYSIDPESLIDALSLEELESKNCIVRTPELEEDLHTVVYECADGNYAAYIFQHPIKYIDDTGKANDISTSINFSSEAVKGESVQNSTLARLRNEYALSSEDNSIKIFYSDKLSSSQSAIVATNSNWTVELTPRMTSKEIVTATLHSINNTETKLRDANHNDSFQAIEYDGAFEDNVSLYYQTTYTGYKELIEIKKPILRNTFEFVLSAGELLPQVSENGELLLIDPNTNVSVANFAQLYVYDSSETPRYTINNSYNIMCLEKAKGLYLITVNVDDEFLSSDDTTYPVIVDPTFSFNTSTAINDAPVYSGIPTVNQGSNYYNHIGYADSSYGNGCLLVKFPALKNSTLFNGLSDSRINSVTYNVKKVGGSNSYTSTLRAYRYTGSAWNESTVTYNSAALSTNTGSLVSSVSMTSNTWYSFNITSAAKAWKNGSANYESGLVIKNYTNTSSTSYDRVLASVEYGKSIDSACMPYVTVVYNNGGTSAGFSSANLAAKDFAQSVYSSSEYARIEYAATIYSLNGKYYYYNVHSGNPHSVGVSKSVPSGATYVAFIHTHPNSENFSSADKDVAESFGGYAYVVTPSYSLKRYATSNNATTTPYTNLTIYPLTSSEKASLKSSLSSTWYGHFVDGTCPSNFGCENKIWPND